MGTTPTTGWDGQSNLTPAPTPQTALTERYVGRGSEPVFYANACQVSKSTHDVSLQLGVVQSVKPGLSVGAAEMTTRVVATVYMSESHARALLGLLQQVLG